MELCRLCKINEASKTNSHIIPWALIKEVVNQEGFKDRDHNVTYAISSFNTPQLHIGRRVLPDHIETVVGANAFEDEIIQRNDFLSRDYIFCPSCEEGIGKIESEFVSRVYNKVDKSEKTNLPSDEKRNKMFQLTEYDTKLTYLLAYTIFFRASIVRFNNYSFITNSGHIFFFFHTFSKNATYNTI